MVTIYLNYVSNELLKKSFKISATLITLSFCQFGNVRIL